MTHASLNIHEPKWNVNRSQRPTTPTSQRPTILHVTTKADKTWESNRHKAASGKVDAWRVIYHRQNAVEKGTLRVGRKLCKQGSSYKKLQKNSRFCIMQNRLMSCWNGTKRSRDRPLSPIWDLGSKRLLADKYRDVYNCGMNILPYIIAVPSWGIFRLFLRPKELHRRERGYRPKEWF